MAEFHELGEIQTNVVLMNLYLGCLKMIIY